MSETDPITIYAFLAYFFVSLIIEINEPVLDKE
jgi:hypothetical protein